MDSNFLCSPVKNMKQCVFLMCKYNLTYFTEISKFCDAAITTSTSFSQEKKELPNLELFLKKSCARTYIKKCACRSSNSITSFLSDWLKSTHKQQQQQQQQQTTTKNNKKTGVER